MRVGHKRRVNGNLHTAAVCRFFDHAKQLDGVAKFAGKLNIEGADVADTFDVNFFRVHPEAVGERGENPNLVRCVVTINVQVRRRFGVTQLLRVRQHRAKIRAFEFHAREDVIAGAVHDAVKRRDAVADKTFAQRLDNGNAAGDARLVIKIGAVFFCRRKKFLAVRGEQRFVGRDDGFAELERGQHNFARHRSAADEFSHKIYFGITDDFAPVQGKEGAWDFSGTGFFAIAHGDAHDL